MTGVLDVDENEGGHLWVSAETFGGSGGGGTVEGSYV